MIFLVALALHAVAAIFWAGTTFTLARTRAAGIEQLRWPQLGAAGIAILTGGYMGHLTHTDTFTRMQGVLLAGAACALVAAVVQFAAGARPRIVVGAQRASAALLAVAAVCMVLARYA